MTTPSEPGFGFSEEVRAYLKVHQRDLVGAVEYDGDDLLAHAKLLALKRSKVELQGYVDGLRAMPFCDLDDEEFRDLCARATTESTTPQGIESEGEAGFWGDSDDVWGSNVGSNDTSIGDGLDFFSRPFGFYGGWPARNFPVVSLQGPDCEQYDGPAQSGSGWDPTEERRLVQEEMAALKRRLQWKFPQAFKGNERTVSHTDEELLPYMEAADFLMGEARRKRSAWRWRQSQAFQDITRVSLTEEQKLAKSSTIDWDEVAKDLDARLAKRRAHTKSPVSNSL